MIVADVNTLAHFWFESTQTEAVKDLLLIDREWAAPLLWRSEFRSVLARQMRLKNLSLTDAVEIWGDAESLIAPYEQLVPSIQVLSLVSESNCSAYDCEYVALASFLGVKLVTHDKLILKEFPQLACTAEQYLKLLRK